MIYYLYASKNKKSGHFGKISSEILTGEQILQLYANSALEAKENEQAYLKELEVYCLGTVDTETGIITSKVEYLLDIGSVIEGAKHGKEEAKQSV